MPQVTKTFTSSVRSIAVTSDGKAVTFVLEWEDGSAPAAPRPVARAGVSAADLSRLGADGAPRTPRRSSTVLRVSGGKVSIQPGNGLVDAPPELARLASELASAVTHLADELVGANKVSP